MTRSAKARALAEAKLRFPKDGAAERWHARGYAAFYGIRRARDRRAALAAYHAAAELGHPYSWTNLGHMYGSGHGARKDERLAFECYLRGAELGDATSKREVAACWIDGLGVKRDVRLGLELLRRLALSDPDSVAALARRCFEGRGVVRDVARGVRMLRRGAAQGHAACQVDLAVHLHDVVDTPRARREALELCRKAARRGSAHACLNLAVAYSSGDGVARDEDRCVRWLRCAVELDEPGEFSCDDAFLLLAKRLLEGNGTPRDRRAGLRLLRTAAERGSERARRKLARLARRR